MRFFSILFLVATLSSLSAGQLELAVIQFPEEKSLEELNAALANQNLTELTNSDRTMTRESYLKGGSVLFAQKVPVGSGSFASVTRIKNFAAHVDGRLSGGKISVKIDLTEGVKAGLRSFQNRVYSGSAALPSGPARVISLRRMKTKSPQVNKGVPTMEVSITTTAIIAQVSR